MARQKIQDTLEALAEFADDSYVRGKMDKAPQKVLIYRNNILQAYKHGYGLARQRQKELPVLPDSVFADAAKEGMKQLVLHLKRPNSAASIRSFSPQGQYIVFVQPRGTTTTPFKKLHKAGVDYLDKYLQEQGHGMKLNKAARRSMGAARHKAHLPDATVGTGQLKLGLQFLMGDPNFEEFSETRYAEELREKFDLDFYYYAKGKGKTSTVGVKEKIEIGVQVLPSFENRAGQEASDWTNVYPKLSEKMYEFAATQPWWDQEGSPTPKEKVIAQGYEVVLDELTKSVASVRVINRQKFKKDTKKKLVKKESRVPDSKRLTSRSRNKTIARELDRRRKQSGYSIHSLLSLINQRLPDYIQDNMVAPRLVYRTGRFANSVAVNLTETAKGYPSIGYTYMRYPYATFAQGGKMYTPDRDPIPLIEKSIRDIALELAIGRYYIRRS